MSGYRSRKWWIIIAGVFLLAMAAQAALAGGYYWRWTGASGYECGNDGDDYLFIDAQSYEYNLPSSGAVISQYEIDGGVSSYIGDITGLSGSGSGTENISTDHNGPSPYTYAFQRDTVVDGKLVYRSTLTYTCTTDFKAESTIVTVTITNEDFGSGICPSAPVGSVVGDMPNNTQAFYAPGKISPDVTINAGTYWVLGEDASGEYYKILLACQYLWVPIDSMQPSYQAPWTGQPLPTQIVQ